MGPLIAAEIQDILRVILRETQRGLRVFMTIIPRIITLVTLAEHAAGRAH